MFAYLDSSVLLRVIFGEPAHLKEFRKIQQAVSSDLLRVECLRAIDRIRRDEDLSESEYLEQVELFHKFQRQIELIPLSREVLNRASQPYPTSLGTLDAIHLASGILYRERLASDLVFCTHDIALSNAAKSLGFTVLS